MKRSFDSAKRNVGFFKEIRRALLTVLLSGVCVSFSTAAMATPTAFAEGGPLPWQIGGSGDWGGARAWLAERGLTFFLMYDFQAQYNWGGIENGWGWESRILPQLNYQFEPLTGLKGTEIQASMAWNVGTDINEMVGSILPPNTAYREDAVRLYELYLGQFLFDEQLHIKVGRIALGPFEYGYSTLMMDFMSSGYQSNPGGFFLNQPTTIYALPIATWGARIAISPKEFDYVLRFAVYNGSPRDLDAGDQNGDFSINLEESTFMLTEFAYKLNRDKEDTGLPGNYKIGVMYDTGSFERFDPSDDADPEKLGNLGFYVMFDQMLWRESHRDHPDDHPAKWKVGHSGSHPTTQGLYGWANFVGNPDKEINISPYWVSAGLTYKGLFPAREADRLAIGFYHTFITSEISLDDETHITAAYRLQITQWLAVGPEFQYFINPLAAPEQDNAAVIGVNLSVYL